MFKGISWSSFFLFMLAAVVLYYVVVGLLYYRAELIEFIKRKGRGGESPVAKAPAQPVLVATGSAFAEQEEELVPTPEPHLPAAAVAAAAATATAGTETSEDPEAKDETTDDGTGKVLSADDAAVADEYENPSERAEEEEIAEAKRLLELGKSNSSAMSENFNNKELNQSNSSEVGNTHIIAKLANDNPAESSPPTMAEFVEPVDLNDDTQPLEMIQLADELVVSDMLIGVSDLNNLLDGLATGEIVPEELAEIAPVFSGTELAARFAANKKRRSQEVESLLSDEE